MRGSPADHPASPPGAESAPGAETLLLYAPVPLHRRPDGGYLLEDQACNGLRLWAANFAKVIVMSPLAPGPAPASWVPVETIGASLARIEIVALPMAYRPDRFLCALRRTRRVIRNLIARSDVMSFSIGGLFGDWGSVAGLEAARMRRPFAVWTDRVESEVVRRTMHSGPLRRRIKARLTHRLIAWYERHLVRRATVGLFHGRETFETYAPYCANPQVVHNIHVTPADHIAPPALEAKAAAAARGAEPLRLCYAGRAEAMKGPFDWIAVLERLGRAGVEFRAEWLGDGPDLEAMRAKVSALGLDGRVALPGFLRDREAVLARLREAELMLFCHKTPESPRCLIEALVSGTPILGYESPFPRDLIAVHGGGLLTPLDDVAALAEAARGLALDRDRLAGLIRRAARDGAPFDDVSVFRHRSEVLRRYLLDPDAPRRITAVSTQPGPKAT